ncbi:carboxypeptidase regulatory-like domain-containing protein [Micrococcales bacterium 31B]|nr:carboxypeptidase regulatory-like domain-containing protein [Micrococcales bacterium 31B]
MNTTQPETIAPRAARTIHFSRPARIVRFSQLSAGAALGILLGAAALTTVAASPAQAAPATVSPASTQASAEDIYLPALSELAHNISQGGIDFAEAEAAAAQAPAPSAQADAWNAALRAAEAAALSGQPEQGTVAVDETGTILATITGNGAPLPGAKVVLDGPSKAVTSTDANGRYLFSQVIPGSYRVWVQLPDGFTVNGSSVLYSSTTLGAKNIDRSLGFNAVR